MTPMLNSRAKITGHLLIRDPILDTTLVDTYNSIHFENFSVAIAESLAHNANGFISEMHFGNGGTNVSGTGTITYFPPQVTGPNANLYNDTFYKVVDGADARNTDPTDNNITVKHLSGTLYSDIIVTCTLGFGEPAGQDAFDNASNAEGLFVFDEIGLKTFSGVGGAGLLLTHVIFNPVQKSLNRLIQIVYTIRIQMA